MKLIQPKKKKQHIKIIVAVVCVLVIAAVIGAIVYLRTDKETQIISSEETTIQEVMSTESIEETTENIAGSKEYYIDYVMVGEGQETGKFLDIRIRFPNGEDYIVVAEKKITYMTETGFYMYLDEKEVRRLSSARTDVEVYEGAMLYLSSYKKKQDEGLTDYPVNLFVLSAYGQYFEDTDQIYSRRIQLEENLLTFMNQTLQK